MSLPVPVPGHYVSAVLDKELCNTQATTNRHYMYRSGRMIVPHYHIGAVFDKKLDEVDPTNL
jgi:hypothetical protein